MMRTPVSRSVSMTSIKQSIVSLEFGSIFVHIKKLRHELKLALTAELAW